MKSEILLGLFLAHSCWLNQKRSIEAQSSRLKAESSTKASHS
jgi:hypothetical protein